MGANRSGPARSKWVKLMALTTMLVLVRIAGTGCGSDGETNQTQVNDVDAGVKDSGKGVSLSKYGFLSEGLFSNATPSISLT